MQRVKMKRNERGSVDGVTNTRFMEGQSYNLPDELATRFVAEGAASRVSGQEAPEDKGAKAETPEDSAPKAETPEDGPTDEKVARAIRELDPDNDDLWTNAGKPEARAISEALGVKVHGAQRDRVWGNMGEDTAE